MAERRVGVCELKAALRECVREVRSGGDDRGDGAWSLRAMAEAGEGIGAG
jgi:hypothetical protein